MPCSQLKVNWRFGTICRFHLLGRPLLSTCFKQISCFLFLWLWRWMWSIYSEMSVHLQQTTRRYIPEDRTLYNHRCDNLKSYIIRFDCDHTVSTKISMRKISLNTRGFSSVKLTTQSSICRQRYFAQSEWVHFIDIAPHENFTSSESTFLLLHPSVLGPLACSHQN
jgi:hypothetical protein